MQYSHLKIGKVCFNECTCSSPVAASAKRSRQLIAIHMATRAKTYFESSFKLLDKNDSNLSTFDRQRHINRILGIAREGSGFDKILFANKGMYQLTI
jgi:hypothetical protein